MQLHLSMPRRASTRMLLSMLIAGLVMPGIANAQTDPGPPPASAATIPTLAEAKSFIERQVPLAGQTTCLGSYTRASAEINGPDLVVVSDSIHDSKDYKSETSWSYKFDIREINFSTEEILNGSCPPHRYLKVICIESNSKCIQSKTSNKTVAADLDFNRDSENYDSSNWTRLETSNIDLTNRIIKALDFYKDKIGQTIGRSSF